MKMLRTILCLTALTAGLYVKAQNDVGSYQIQKCIVRDQSSASALNFDPTEPYLFYGEIDRGTNGALFTNAALTLPAGSTGSVLFTNEDSESKVNFSENFTSQAALNAAFPSGTGIYGLTIQTDTFNSYSDQMTFGSDSYPAIPQITGLSNATWSGTSIAVTDITKPVTITFNNPVGGFAYFEIENPDITSDNYPNNGTPTTFTIPANNLSNNTFTSGQIKLYYINGTDANGIPNAYGAAQFSTQINFNLKTGTPTVTSSYLVFKKHILVQTSNSAPVNAVGDPNESDYAPYSFSIESPVSGTTTGPSATSFPLAFKADGGTSDQGDYEYSSGPVASLSLLNSTYPDGSYTLPGAVHVSLTGDGYPAAPQIVTVNGATPVWNAQGLLVLDPTISNTIAWTPVTVANFATDGHESASFNSTSVNAGVLTSTATPFTTLTVAAHTMLSGGHYGGGIKYYASPSFSNPNANLYEGALYETGTMFNAVATSTAIPDLYFQNSTSLGILTLNANFLPIGWHGVGGLSTGWVERAIADVNGDGIPDIIFQNGTNLGALTLNASGAPVSWIGIGSMNSGWELRGAAYITGDGKLDLIFQNGTSLGFLEVNSSGVPQSWNGIGAMGAGWELRAVADLNGDGHPDLLFQNGMLLGALQVGTNGLPTAWNGIGAMGAGWTLSDAVDVNGDGQPDLIFQNGTLLGALQVNTSFAPVAWHGIGAMGSGWTLPGDY
jgi:hypothetical protein